MVRRLPLEAHLVRRLLVNYRVDPATLESVLPTPMRPRLVGGWGVAGICVISLGGMRPEESQGELGVRSQNAAHRIAVEWETPEGLQSGVYIARRDTDSIINALAGGRIFPGLHHRACFHVVERSGLLRMHFSSIEGDVSAGITVTPCERFQPSTLFASLEDASEFFSFGAPAYSVTRDPLRLDGVTLSSEQAYLEPVEINDATSSIFEDSTRFPTGTAYLDSAFLMRNVPVEWRALPSIRAMPRLLAAVAAG